MYINAIDEQVEVAPGDGIHIAETVAETGVGGAWGRIALGVAMIGLGIRGLVYGDFAGVWQRIPIELPAREYFAWLAAAVELATGIGLLTKRTVAVSSGVLVVFLLLWTVLLKLPVVFAAPLAEISWLGFGEIAVILAGGWATSPARTDCVLLGCCSPSRCR